MLGTATRQRRRQGLGFASVLEPCVAVFVRPVHAPKGGLAGAGRRIEIAGKQAEQDQESSSAFTPSTERGHIAFLVQIRAARHQEGGDVMEKSRRGGEECATAEQRTPRSYAFSQALSI